MSLDEKFISVRTGFYDGVGKLFESLAQFFGYPETRVYQLFPQSPVELMVDLNFLVIFQNE